MKKISILLLTYFLVSSLFAQDDKERNIGIGITAGTNGYGGEVSFALSPKLVLRGGYTTFELPEPLEFTTEDFLATVNLQLGGPSVMVDYYLLKQLHLTVGGLYNNFNVLANLTPTQTFMINDIEIDPATVGDVTLQLGPGNTISPYAGIGFGRSLGLTHRLAFNFEIGAFYLQPMAVLSATGMIEETGNEENNANLNDYLSDYPFYPNVSFTLSYKLFNF